ncbi:hypothetical protein D3C81_1399690 [compost metagenome]
MDVAGADSDYCRGNSDPADMYLTGICSALGDEILVLDPVGICCILHVLNQSAVGNHRRIINAQQCALTELAEGLAVAGHVGGSTGIQAEKDVRCQKVGCCARSAEASLFLHRSTGEDRIRQLFTVQRLDQFNCQADAIAVVPRLGHNFLRIGQRCKRADRQDLLARFHAEALGFLPAVCTDIQIHFADIAGFVTFLRA